MISFINDLYTNEFEESFILFPLNAIDTKISKENIIILNKKINRIKNEKSLEVIEKKFNEGEIEE